MDKKPNQDTTTNNVAESIVGPSVKIEGDLKSQGNLRVDGTVNGKLKTAQNLYVGETANITADVEAENAVISGAVQGNVKIAAALVLTKTAKLNGDINCGSLRVEEGAYFFGKCQMREAGNAYDAIPEAVSKKIA
jgi:cytoskeletal protein CcmA (bactofilin family)